MDSNSSRLDHNDRPLQISLAEAIQIFFDSFDQRADGSPMKSAEQNDAWMGSRRVDKDACNSQVTCEEDRAQRGGVGNYQVIRRAGQPDFCDVLGNVTGSGEG